MTFRRPTVAAIVTTSLAMVTLLWLGWWQMERRAWKLDILEQIQTRLVEQPVTAPLFEGSAAEYEYLRVHIEGVFDHTKEKPVYALGPGGAPGYNIYTPLKATDGRTFIINRGWVPDKLRAADTRREGQLPGLQSLTGLLRASRSRGWFVPENDATGDRWFVPVVNELADAMDLTGVQPVFIDAGSSDIPGGWPQGGLTRVDIPNNHLEYAITWFSLALVLLVIFLVYLRQVPDVD